MNLWGNQLNKYRYKGTFYFRIRSMQQPGDTGWIKKYTAYLKLEKSLSANTVDAYLKDVSKLADYLDERVSLVDVTPDILEHFFAQLRDVGIHARSQARILSGIKSFYGFLILEEVIEADPTDYIDAPTIGRHLPEVLSLDEIDSIIQGVDVSKKEGQRNRAMLETLYSCGLRVSELINLKLSHCYFEDEYIQVEGKGGKQRLVPISRRAIDEIDRWLVDRNQWPIGKGQDDYVFLNRNGFALTRSMVFRIVQYQAGMAGIQRIISPHTFRHSFATHLLEGGANLRLIQQMLGHESIQTTEVYTHMDKTFLREQILSFHPRNDKP